MKMRAFDVCAGAMVGTVVTLVLVNVMYPDVPRRLARDGRRFIRQTKRTVCDIGDMMSKS